MELSSDSTSFLEKLDNFLRDRIEKRLKNLTNNPISSDSKFITRDKDGESIFRYRIGNYRALYKVKEKQKIVLVTKIDKRPRVYDRL